MKMTEKQKVTKTVLANIRKFGLRYVPPSKGLHITGFPARNLSGDDCARFNVKELEAAMASGLYEVGTSVLEVPGKPQTEVKDE